MKKMRWKIIKERTLKGFQFLENSFPSGGKGKYRLIIEKMVRFILTIFDNLNVEGIFTCFKKKMTKTITQLFVYLSEF